MSWKTNAPPTSLVKLKVSLRLCALELGREGARSLPWVLRETHSSLHWWCTFRRWMRMEEEGKKKERERERESPGGKESKEAGKKYQGRGRIVIWEGKGGGGWKIYCTQGCSLSRLMLMVKWCKCSQLPRLEMLLILSPSDAWCVSVLKDALVYKCSLCTLCLWCNFGWCCLLAPLVTHSPSPPLSFSNYATCRSLFVRLEDAFFAHLKVRFFILWGVREDESCETNLHLRREKEEGKERKSQLDLGKFKVEV